MFVNLLYSQATFSSNLSFEAFRQKYETWAVIRHNQKAMLQQRGLEHTSNYKVQENSILGQFETTAAQSDEKVWNPPWSTLTQKPKLSWVAYSQPPIILNRKIQQSKTMPKQTTLGFLCIPSMKAVLIKANPVLSIETILWCYLEV